MGKAYRALMAELRPKRRTRVGARAAELIVEEKSLRDLRQSWRAGDLEASALRPPDNGTPKSKSHHRTPASRSLFYDLGSMRPKPGSLRCAQSG